MGNSKAGRTLSSRGHQALGLLAQHVGRDGITPRPTVVIYPSTVAMRERVMVTPRSSGAESLSCRSAMIVSNTATCRKKIHSQTAPVTWNPLAY
jgi:hypothetical protein